MLTEALVSGTYQQYKQDTNYLTNWLSQTAIKCGYDIKHLARASPKKQGALKYTVSAQEIKNQAQLIARCVKPRIIVPVSVMKATKDAIEARKMCSVSYNNLDSSEEASNKGHKLFISTLETILSILQTMGNDKARTRTLSMKQENIPPANHALKESVGRQNKKHSTQPIQNKFSGLEIEENKMEYNEWTSHLKPVTKANPRVDPSTLIFEAESTGDEEKQFELLCFFKDLCEVRRKLRSVWSQYKNGELSLIVASILTNVAISSIKDMEESLAERHGFANLENRINIFAGFFTYEEDGKLIKPVSGSQTNTISHEDFQDLKDTVGTICNFMFQYQAELSSIDADFEEGDVKGTPMYCVTLSKMLLSRSKKVTLDHKRLSRLLMEFAGFHEFCLLSDLEPPHSSVHYVEGPVDTTKKGKDVYAEDMISQAMKAILEKNQMDIWTVLACRFYLDASSVLGEASQRPYEELICQAASMNEEIQTKTPGDDLKGWMGCPSCPQCGSAELRRSAHHIDLLVGKQPYGKIKAWMFFSMAHRYPLVKDQPDKIHITPHSSSFYQQNMLYCGTVSLSLLMDFELMGIEFEKRFGAIQIVSHLYHAGRMLDHVEVEPVPELDNFIQKQGYVLFGTAIPKTFKAAYDCFLRSTGAYRGSKSRDANRAAATFRPAPTKTIRRNRTFDFLRQHYHGESSMQAALCNLMAQNGLHHDGITSDTSSSGDSNLVFILQTLSHQLSIQLPEVNKANYWTLANKCIWALSLIRTKLNHDFGNQYTSLSDDPSEPTQARMRWFPMIANVLQGAGEAVTGEPLTGISLSSPAVRAALKANASRNTHGGNGHAHRHQAHTDSHTDPDIKKIPMSTACHCCGLFQLRTALDVLPKVWAWKKKLETENEMEPDSEDYDAWQDID